MMTFIPAMILATQIAMPVADRTPHFNIEPTCTGAASTGTGGTREICVEKENQARAELDRQWTAYPGADRSRCVESTGAGGIPSYVELLTCLEMAKQARDLPKDEGLTTTGTGPAL